MASVSERYWAGVLVRLRVGTGVCASEQPQIHLPPKAVSGSHSLRFAKAPQASSNTFDANQNQRQGRFRQRQRGDAPLQRFLPPQLIKYYADHPTYACQWWKSLGKVSPTKSHPHLESHPAAYQKTDPIRRFFQEYSPGEQPGLVDRYRMLLYNENRRLRIQGR